MLNPEQSLIWISSGDEDRTSYVERLGGVDVARAMSHESSKENGVVKRRSARFLTVVVSTVLVMSVVFPAHAAVRPGTKCSRVGVTKSGLVCKRVGGNLIWIKRSAPVRTPIVTPEPIRLLSGLVKAEYDGYFNDQPGWFQGRKPVSAPKLVSKISLLGETKEKFSVEYTGYLIPDVDGLWTFRVVSDEASYLWIGKEAIAGFTYGNALLAMPGIRGPATSHVSVYLRKGERYGLRLQYGDNTGYEQLELAIRRPGANAFFTDLTVLVSAAVPAGNVGVSPDFASLQPVNPLEIDPATEFMEKLIADSSKTSGLNRTRVVLHVEPGANGKYPALSEEAVSFAIEWYANVLTPLTQSQINVILWRTDAWLEQKIRLYAPAAPAQIDLVNFPHNAALYPEPAVANIGTNLATVVGGRRDAPRNLDISNLESPTYFAGQAHEAFHNWQASIETTGLLWDKPIWFHEGMAQLFGYAAMAKHSGEPGYFRGVVPKLSDPEGYARNYCTSGIRDFNNYCSYFQGMYVSQYFLYRFGIPAYLSMLRGHAGQSGFASNFKIATGVTYEEFCDDVDRYLATIGWRG